jgi:hypothetical protein
MDDRSPSCWCAPLLPRASASRTRHGARARGDSCTWKYVICTDARRSLVPYGLGEKCQVTDLDDARPRGEWSLARQAGTPVSLALVADLEASHVHPLPQPSNSAFPQMRRRMGEHATAPPHPPMDEPTRGTSTRTLPPGIEIVLV